MTDAERHLRNLVNAAADDEETRAAAQKLLRLLDHALAEAQLEGMRLLARTVPHELAQPLALIRGYAELLQERGYTAEEERRLLGEVQAAAARLAAQIRAIERLAEEPRPAERTTIGGVELLRLPEV